MMVELRKRIRAIALLTVTVALLVAGFQLRTDDASAVTFSGPVTITAGGTYSPISSGVDIKTTQPVVLENCSVKATNRVLVTVPSGANVTIRNCSFEGSATPNNAGYRAVFANSPASLTVVNNDFLHIAAVKVVGGTPTISILRNRIRDVIGDDTNCCGGGFAPALQLSNLTTPNTEIAWNEIINTPGQSNMEDGVNLFAASGSDAAHPMRITNNFIWGAYPLPITDGFSGGGILTGDGGGGTHNITATNNQIVGTTNYGLQIGGGNNNHFDNNRVVASGQTADGTPIPGMNVGGTFWTYNTAPTNSTMNNNVFGWMRPPNGNYEPTNSTWHRVDTWMPAVGTNGNVATGNTSLTPSSSTRITYANEVNEFNLWTTKSASVSLGNTSGTSLFTTNPTTPTTSAPTTTTTAAPTTTTAAPTTTTTVAPTTSTTVAPTTSTTAPGTSTTLFQAGSRKSSYSVLLSSLAPVSASNGWGPYEIDRSNNERPAGDGRTMRINGSTFKRGLGVHAPSDLAYKIDGSYRTFTASIGVDDESTIGSVVFEVWVDGNLRYRSPTMTSAGGARAISVDITGGQQLRLVVTDAGNGTDGDHGDWGDARLGR